MENQTIINKNTLLPIGLVITIIGAVVWLTAVYSQAAESGRKLDHYIRSIENIDRRLSRIEGRLGIQQTDEN